MDQARVKLEQTEPMSLNIPFGRYPFSQLSTHFDPKNNTAWLYMNGQPRPCFTPTLLKEIDIWHENIRREVDREQGVDLRYLVAASKTPGIFNLGGDLNLFKQCIAERDEVRLLDYAYACIKVLYNNLSGLDRGLTTISLVQGDALGGGFEAAISSHVLVAERSAKMGLPEVFFNLFPGMGAYSILSRKVGPVEAERMMLSGKLYTAVELFEMGVVDVLAEDGQGEMAVYDYMRKEDKAPNSYQAIRRVKNACNPVTYEELKEITEIWVEAAMRLTPRDLRMMARLVSRQSQRRLEPGQDLSPE